MVVLARARLSRAATGRRPTRGRKQLFAFSILYLFVLFAVLLVERGSRLLRVGWLRMPSWTSSPRRASC